MTISSLSELDSGIFFVHGSTCSGVFAGPGGHSILIDTGPEDPDWAESLDAVLRSEGLIPLFIVNTHAHADHCGSNAFFIKTYGAKTACSEVEAVKAENPVLEPMLMFGAMPPQNLMNKYLLFEPFKVDIPLKPGSVLLDGIGFEMIPLPGHTPGHVGIGKGDVLFVGDAFTPADDLGIHPIPIYWDVKMAIRSLKTILEYLRTGVYKTVISSHGGKLVNPLRDVLANLNRIRSVLYDLTERADKGDMTFDAALEMLVDKWNMNLCAPTEYFLIRSAIHACLSYLVNARVLRMVFRNSRVIWYPSSNRNALESIISQEMV